MPAIWGTIEAVAPYARIYECKHCGDSGEPLSTQEDIERAKKIAATDSLHRSRAYEKVAALNDEDRVYVSDIKKLVKWYEILLKYTPEIIKGETKEEEKA